MISCAGEYGATRASIQHEWVGGGNFTYDSAAWVGAFRNSSDLLAGMVRNRGLSSAIYTQISDVEAELNGIQSYDRVLKLPPRDADEVRALNRRLWRGGEGARPAALPLLASVFSDNAVLQRAPAAPRVWGWAAPGAGVEVRLSSSPRPLVATAAPDGGWSVLLPPQPAASGVTLSVRAVGGAAVSRADVAFGEVLLFSGQSNMDFDVRRAFFSADVVRHARDPLLRVVTLETTVSDAPRPDAALRAMPTRGWQQAAPSTLANVSAVAYFAGRELRRWLGDVPVGLIFSYVSGTPIEPWLPLSQNRVQNITCNSAQACSTLYNGMIHPLRQYSLAGMAWWQGEGNYANMLTYGSRFKALISSWRAAWASLPTAGDIPFFFFYLEPYSLGWYNILRSQQQQALALPNVSGVNVLDIGDRGSPYGTVHIRNKQVSGYRLSLQILQMVYGHRNTAVGPVMLSAKRLSAKNGSQTVSVTFDDQAWPMPMRVLPTEQCRQCCNEGENPFSAGPSPVASEMKSAVHASVDSDGPLAATVQVQFALTDSRDLRYIGLHFVPYPECTLHGGTGLPAQPAVLAVLTNGDEVG